MELSLEQLRLFLGKVVSETMFQPMNQSDWDILLLGDIAYQPFSVENIPYSLTFVV